MAEAVIKIVGKDSSSQEVKKAELAIRNYTREVASADQIAQKFRKTVSTPINSEAVKATQSMAEAMKRMGAESTVAKKTLESLEAESKRLTAEFRRLEIGTAAFVAKGKELSAVNAELGKLRSGTGGGVGGLAALISPQVAALVTGGAIVKGLYDIGKASVVATSNLNELRSAAQVTFEQAFAQVEKRAGEIAQSVGRAQSSILGFATDIGSIIKPMGLSAQATQDMSLNLAKLSVDIASFRNVTDQRAFEALRSAIVGQSEPLRRLGVDVQDTNIKLFALKNGIKDNYETMNQAQKAALRYAYIMNQTKDAQGDAARTAQGFANQSRALKDEFKKLGEELGKDITPVAAKAIGGIAFLVRTLTSDLINARNAWGKLMSMMGGSGGDPALAAKIGLGPRAVPWMAPKPATPFGPSSTPEFKGDYAAIPGLKDQIEDLKKLGSASSAGGEKEESIRSKIASIESEILQTIGEQAKGAKDRLTELKEELDLKAKLGVLTDAERTKLDRINNRVDFQTDKVHELTDAWKEQQDALKQVEDKISDISKRIQETQTDLAGRVADINRDTQRSKEEKAGDLYRELADLDAKLARGEGNSASDQQKRQDIEAALATVDQATRQAGQGIAGENPFQAIQREAERKIADAKAEAEAKIAGYKAEQSELEKTRTQLILAEQDKKNAVLTALAERQASTEAVYKQIEERTTVHVNQQLAEFARLTAKVGSPGGASAVAPVKERAVGGFSSGLTLVGERGVELVDLPAGSYVHNARESSRMARPSVTLQVGDIHVHNEADEDRLMAKLARLIQKQSLQAAY